MVPATSAPRGRTRRLARQPLLQRAAPGLQPLRAQRCWGRHRPSQGEEMVAGFADGDRAEKHVSHELESSGGEELHWNGGHEQWSRRGGRKDHGHDHGHCCGEHEAQGARRRCDVVHGGRGGGSGHGELHRRGEVRRTVDEQHETVSLSSPCLPMCVQRPSLPLRRRSLSCPVEQC